MGLDQVFIFFNIADIAISVPLGRIPKYISKMNAKVWPAERVHTSRVNTLRANNNYTVKFAGLC